MTIDQIPLANANANQNTVDGVKGDWVIRENITDRELAVFDGRISDEDMFNILRFARKYELEAFNTGIRFQKERENVDVQRLISEREAIIVANDKLSETVERLTSKTRG